MRTLSLEPLAFVIDGYLEADIASLVIEEAIAAGLAFQRSVFAATDGNAVMDKMRTSQQVTLIPGGCCCCRAGRRFSRGYLL